MNEVARSVECEGGSGAAIATAGAPLEEIQNTCDRDDTSRAHKPRDRVDAHGERSVDSRKEGR